MIEIKDIFGSTPAPLLWLEEIIGSSSTQLASAVGWNKRNFNTIHTNDIKGCSVAAGTISLPAGLYLAEYVGATYVSQGVRAFLRDTAGNVLLAGLNIYNYQLATHAPAGTDCVLVGIFSLPVATDVEISQWHQKAHASGMGLNAGTSFAPPITYATLLMSKLK